MEDNDATPLYMAVGEGHHAITKLLLDYGADVDHICTHLGSAICIAFAFGRTEVIEVLQEAGVRFDVKDEDGRYPICYAVHNRYFDTVRKYVHIYKDILTAEEMQKLITMARLKGMHDISFE
ncbi:MAG: ankyrin repeat domain-containing protein [Armatimonadota bacterium]